MTAAQKLAFALVVPAAVGAAWITSRAAAPEPSEDRGAEIARLQERLDRIEKSVAASPRPAPSDDRALGRRLEAIEARIEDVAKNAAASTAPAGGAAPKGESTAAAMAAKAATDAGKKKDDAKAELAGLLAALKAIPGSPEHLAALKELAEWIVRRAGPPADEEAVAMAEGILEAEARNGRITPTEAAELLPSLERLPQDNAARPGLACVVAGGWAKDERLGGLLDRFAANTEMRVHRRHLSLLDHFPSAAFGDYVIRLVRDERDASILQSALDVDRVDAGANAENAVRFMQAVEGRIADGSLDAKMRRRAGAAITMAGMRSQDAGAELLRRLAERESDQAVAAAYRDGAESLGKRTPLSPKAVEKIFD
jgi:hypothetical protein